MEPKLLNQKQTNDLMSNAGELCDGRFAVVDGVLFERLTLRMSATETHQLLTVWGAEDVFGLDTDYLYEADDFIEAFDFGNDVPAADREFLSRLSAAIAGHR